MAETQAGQPDHSTKGQEQGLTARPWKGWNPLFLSSLVVSGLGGLAGGGPLQKLLGEYLGEDVPLPLYMALASVPFLLAAGLLKVFFDAWWNRVRGNFERWGGLFLTGMTGRYRRYMLRTVKHVGRTGLDTGAGKADFELSDVYVDVALDRSSPDGVSNDLLDGMEGHRRPLSHFLDEDGPSVFAVIGAPGSGKTTLLHHTVRRLCGERGRWRRIPVLIYLNEHAGMIADRPEVSLAAVIRKAVGPDHLREPQGWFEQQLSLGRCVVMLDGLDEVGSGERRRAVSGWVRKQTEIHHRNTFVLTSRPHGYQSNQVTGAHVLRVRPFTREQISEFTRGWFRAHEQLGEDPRGTAEELLARVWGRNALRELAVNPMLLSMIVSVHLNHGRLPDTRADLYREMFQVVLWKRQANVKGVAPKTSGEEQERLLSGIAHRMMSDRVRSRSREELEEVVGRELLVDLIRCGAVVERGNGECAFAHHTFQEYLAAAYMRRKGLPEKLAEKVTDSWWRETLLLYSAVADANPVVRTALEIVVGAGHRGEDSSTLGKDLPALLLAHECAEQTRDLEQGLRLELGELLARGLDPKASEALTRLTTRVYADRDLRELVPLEGGGYVCAQPVSVDLYRHFLRDSRKFGEFRMPDAPGFVDRGPLDDSGPVRGVWGADARAFAAWINHYTPKEERWRLPTPAELASEEYRPFLRELRSVWVEENRERKPVTFENEGENGVLLLAQALRKHIARDVGDDPVLVEAALRDAGRSERRGPLPDLVIRVLRRGMHDAYAVVLGAAGGELATRAFDLLVERLSKRSGQGEERRTGMNTGRQVSAGVYDPAGLVEQAESVLRQVENETEEQWRGPAAQSVLRTVREVFGREKALTEDVAGQARMRAVLLALESGPGSALGGLCWDIVEALSILEMRQGGDFPANTTIILARD